MVNLFDKITQAVNFFDKIGLVGNVWLAGEESNGIHENLPRKVFRIGREQQIKVSRLSVPPSNSHYRGSKIPMEQGVCGKCGANW